MTNTQVTLVQLDNYGPWTVTPEPRPEPDLQSLQASLFADLADAFGAREGYVFFARFDNVVAVTNGIDRATHERIQTQIRNRYPVTVSVAGASGPTPAEALRAATADLQASGGAQDGDRSEALVGEFGGGGDLQVAHFDVIDATERYTDRLDAFATYARIERTHLALLSHLYETHGALTFFVGGDNFIAVCPDLDAADYETTIETVRHEADVDLRVGVGRGETASAAGMAAKHALEDGRETGRAVVGDLPATTER